MKPPQMWQVRLICFLARMVRKFVASKANMWMHCGKCGGTLPMDSPEKVKKHYDRCFE